MAMEFHRTIHDSHPKNILCIQFNSIRREIYSGGEETTPANFSPISAGYPDAVIRVWEAESGKLLDTLVEHVGWITSLLYW
ncbi:hypothetical protein BDK51DRAFT_43185 [Blyttiomyces helicus]|uniref:WD40-repeat-containing domain protein n=1 Tax=Blyttiomyces helicus TaxID=388810 RepID=A0A4P9VWD1_9FUNG|nr:hypothetical protein BDK51DRAFT_43185 [Blyttiomyces helicus]|eukprot:RKO84001.1 hypothetical protein BDK51DRAFT_43185 [Blyttiomyces helicus]